MLLCVFNYFSLSKLSFLYALLTYRKGVTITHAESRTVVGKLYPKRKMQVLAEAPTAQLDLDFIRYRLANGMYQGEAYDCMASMSDDLTALGKAGNFEDLHLVARYVFSHYRLARESAQDVFINYGVGLQEFVVLYRAGQKLDRVRHIATEALEGSPRRRFLLTDR